MQEYQLTPWKNSPGEGCPALEQGVLGVGIYPRAGGERGSWGAGVNVAARGGCWTLCLVRKEISLLVELPGVFTGTGECKTFLFLARRARRIWSFLKKMLSTPC